MDTVVWKQYSLAFEFLLQHIPKIHKQLLIPKIQWFHSILKCAWIVNLT